MNTIDTLPEALIILRDALSINKQFDNFVNILKLHAHRNINEEFCKSIEGFKRKNEPPNTNLKHTTPQTVSLADNSTFQSPLSLDPLTHDPMPLTTINCTDPCMYIERDNHDADSLPDLSDVLAKFGINFEELEEVPLGEYQWYSFKTHDSIDNVTISQRIKSMTRKARASHTTQSQT